MRYSGGRTETDHVGSSAAADALNGLAGRAGDARFQDGNQALLGKGADYRFRSCKAMWHFLPHRDGRPHSP